MAEEFYGIREMLDRAEEQAAGFSFIDASTQGAYQAHVMSIFAAAYAEMFATRVERPDWVPYIPYYFPRATPNPDTVYSYAPVDSRGTYRIWGRRGSETIAAITYRKGGAHLGTRPGPRVGEIDFDDFELSERGEFDVLISEKKPGNHAGQWFPLHPETESFMLRRITKESSEIDSTCNLERVDSGFPSLALSNDVFREGFDKVCRYTLDQNLFLLGYIQKLHDHGAAEGFIADDQSPHGGLIIQQHFFHLYRLDDDEALILEVRAPSRCKYWSAQVITPFAGSVDFVTRQSSLNDHQAVVEADSMIRIVVSGEDPGVANWLDTCGWKSGGIQWRWNDIDSSPKPVVRRVKRDRLKEYFPERRSWISPGERGQSLSERIGYHQSRRR